MNKLFGPILGGAFFVFSVILIAWTASLTMAFVSRVLPNQWMAPYLSVIVFDLGMLMWLFVFRSHAQGIYQKAIALSGTILDLVGIGIMVVTEILTDGQTFAEIPQNLGALAIWVLGIWTFANVLLAAVFHLTDPAVIDSILERIEEDQLVEKARAKTRTRIRAASEVVSEEMAAVRSGRVLQRLRGPVEPVYRIQAPNVQVTDTVNSNMTPSQRAQCTAIRGDGRQCTRLAQPGTHHCFQHQQEHAELE